MDAKFDLNFLRDIENKPAWQASCKYARVITLRVGMPFLNIRPAEIVHCNFYERYSKKETDSVGIKKIRRKKAFIDAEWTILVQANWELNLPDRKKHLYSNSSKKSELEKNLSIISGHSIKNILINELNMNVRIEFNENSYLNIFINEEDDDDYCGVIFYERAGNVYGVSKNGIKTEFHENQLLESGT